MHIGEARIGMSELQKDGMKLTEECNGGTSRRSRSGVRVNAQCIPLSNSQRMNFSNLLKRCGFLC